MKHITFSAKCIAPMFSTVEVQILAQTHLRNNFGRCGTSSYTHNGLTLSSMNNPENRSSTQVFVRGDWSCGDLNKIVLTTAQYAKFKAAVEAYNKEFAAKPAPVASPCSYIIG